MDTQAGVASRPIFDLVRSAATGVRGRDGIKCRCLPLGPQTEDVGITNHGRPVGCPLSGAGRWR